MEAERSAASRIDLAGSSAGNGPGTKKAVRRQPGRPSDSALPQRVAVEQHHQLGTQRRTFLVDDEILAKNLDWSEPVQFRFEPEGDHYMLVMRKVDA